jgi:hypothetical protein
MKMNTVNKTSRILGVAFLFQFFTSIISSAIILPQASGISAMSMPENIGESMVRIANHAGLMMADILGEMFTALGIIFLGAILFVVLGKQNKKTALVALGFYIMEATLLAVSRLGSFSLLRISQEYVAAGRTDYLLAMGKLAIESTSYGYTLHTLPFCFGAVLFYYLLDKSRIVPRVLSLWGLISVSPFLIGVPLTLLGYEFPFLFYLPYVPFEFAIGAWIFFKGIQDRQQ